MHKFNLYDTHFHIYLYCEKSRKREKFLNPRFIFWLFVTHTPQNVLVNHFFHDALNALDSGTRTIFEWIVDWWSVEGREYKFVLELFHEMKKSKSCHWHRNKKRLCKKYSYHPSAVFRNRIARVCVENIKEHMFDKNYWVT